MPILPIDAGRYGSEEVKRIFEEEQVLKYNLEFEAVVAEAQGMLGIIPKEASNEIAYKARSNLVRIDRVKELEAVREHDVAAMVEALVEVCSDIAKPWVHYGLTSYDVVDTRIAMQMRDSLRIIEDKVKRLTLLLADKALAYKDIPAVGRTHGQHASIISFGLKFAVWASDMLMHLERLKEVKKRVLVCKTLGVVGTGSLMKDKALEVQRVVAERLNLYPVDAATQVVSRERIAEFIAALTLIACTLDKIAVEIRNLQRSEIDEVMEPFKEGQMGSSAVPVKRNPIKSERISSIARLMHGILMVALENVALWHERDLSNSANERFIIPMSIILLDEMLNSMINVIANLKVNTDNIARNLMLTKGQIFAEFVLDALIRKGMSRIEAYKLVQSIAFEASNKGIEFLEALKSDERISNIITRDELDNIFNAKEHLGASYIIIKEIADRVTTICK
jgi:Adenylosuccinate lyase (EC 4.3.2.2)